jgi:hypothetical protein
MKSSFHLLGVLFASLFAATAGADITLTGNSSSGNDTGLVPLPGAPLPAEKADNSPVPPSNWRNFYYDANGDLAFNEADGDTWGNTTESLGLDVTIPTTGKVLDFYIDNNAKSTFGDNFKAGKYRLDGLTIKLGDDSDVPLSVTQNAPQVIDDADGQHVWLVALRPVGYLEGDLTDIVTNIDSEPNGQGPDYHFALAFLYGENADFDLWAAAFDIPADEQGDDDHDSIPALLEYLLGYNPTLPETMPAPQPDGIGGYIVAWPVGSMAATDPEITYEVKVSTDLVHWEDPDPDDLLDSGVELVLTLPAGQDKVFARLEATRTP